MDNPFRLDIIYRLTKKGKLMWPFCDLLMGRQGTFSLAIHQRASDDPIYWIAANALEIEALIRLGLLEEKKENEK